MFKAKGKAQHATLHAFRYTTKWI